MVKILSKNYLPPGQPKIIFLQVKEKVMVYLFLGVDNDAAWFCRYPGQKNLQFDEWSWNFENSKVFIDEFYVLYFWNTYY